MTKAWIELVRPANVATASADVLAGFAVTGLTNRGALPWLLASSACLYAGGVVLNDLFDRHLDAVERPERPLPSGRISPRQARWLGAALLAMGVTTASLATTEAGVLAGALAALVLLYDAWGKHQAIVGPLNMGLCRGLNLTLGMAAVPAVLVVAWPLALVTVAYICGVTALSRGEVRGGPRGVAVLALAFLGGAIAALATLSLRPGRESWPGLALTLVLAWRVLPAYGAAYRHPGPGPVRHAVTRGVLSLVLVDAVVAAVYAGIGYSLVVLAVALLAGGLARFFAVT